MQIQNNLQNLTYSKIGLKNIYLKGLYGFWPIHFYVQKINNIDRDRFLGKDRLRQTYPDRDRFTDSGRDRFRT